MIVERDFDQSRKPKTHTSPLSYNDNRKKKTIIGISNEDNHISITIASTQTRVDFQIYHDISI